MDTRIVAVYCLCDDMLKALHHRDDPQTQMTDAEVMTTAIVAALDYGGNMEKARFYIWHKEGPPVKVSRLSLSFHTYHP